MNRKIEIKEKIIQSLLLTFLISWTCFVCIIIANRFGKLKYGTPLFMILYIIGGNAAPIVSYILLKKWNEIKGLKDFIKQNFKVISGLKNYLILTILLVVHFSISIALGQTNYDIPVYAVCSMIPMNILLGGLEEIGWRGIIQYNLEKKLSFVIATIIVGVLWSIWHLPFWFIEGTVQSTMSFLMFSISILGTTFLLAAIRKTTENIWLCILFHSCINSFTVLLSVSQGANVIVTTIVEILIALIIVSIQKKRSGSIIR